MNATKIEKTGIHFKTDVFVTVAVVDTKTTPPASAAGSDETRLDSQTRVLSASSNFLNFTVFRSVITFKNVLSM